MAASELMLLMPFFLRYSAWASASALAHRAGHTVCGEGAFGPFTCVHIPQR